MSFSLEIRVKKPLPINVQELRKETCRIAAVLLNQVDTFYTKVDIVEVGTSLLHPSEISIDGSMYSLIGDGLFDGADFFYREIEDWGDVDVDGAYSYAIFFPQLYRNRGDGKLVFCIAMLIAAADLFSVDCIYDDSGVLDGGDDKVPTKALLAMANKEKLSFDKALILFYDKFPGLV